MDWPCKFCYSTVSTGQHKFLPVPVSIEMALFINGAQLQSATKWVGTLRPLFRAAKAFRVMWSDRSPRICHRSELTERTFSSYGNTLTVRKFGSLAVQSSLWTEWKYWTVSSERSVRSNFSVGENVMLQKKHVSWRVKHWVTRQRSTMGKKIWLSMHLKNFGSDKTICTSTLSCWRM